MTRSFPSCSRPAPNAMSHHPPISLSWHLLNLCCSRSFLCHVPPWLSPASAIRAQWAEWPCYKSHNITSLEPCTALLFTQPKRHIPYSGLQSPANKTLSSPPSFASLGPATQSLADTWISMPFSVNFMYFRGSDKIHFLLSICHNTKLKLR